MPNYSVFFKTEGKKKPQKKKVWAESVTEAESAVKKLLPEEAIILGVGREHDIPTQGVIRSF